MVGRGGFEPPKRSAADLQSAPFGHSGTYPHFPYCRAARRWSWRWDLNPQPADYKSAALPIELRQPIVRSTATPFGIPGLQASLRRQRNILYTFFMDCQYPFPSFSCILHPRCFFIKFDFDPEIARRSALFGSPRSRIYRFKSRLWVALSATPVASRPHACW